MNSSPLLQRNGQSYPGAFVRSMLRSDLPQILAIEREVYSFPWSEGNFKDSLKSGYDGWVIEVEQQIKGYAFLMWVIDEAHLLNLSVHSAYQKQGLGAAILRWVKNDTALRGARAMLLEVRPSNLSAISLYLKSDFIEIGRRKNYYPSWAGKREDAMVMQAALTQTMKEVQHG